MGSERIGTIVSYCPKCGSVLNENDKCPRCDAKEAKQPRSGGKVQTIGIEEVAIKDLEEQNRALRSRIRELESTIKGLRELIGHIQSDTEMAQKEMDEIL